MKPIICLGGLTIDEIFHVAKFPETDDAQMILSSRESYGGRGALVALTLGMLDVPVSLFTAVGNDFKERGYESFLREQGVSLEGTVECDNEPCFNTKVFVANRRDTITFFQMRFLDFGEPNKTHFRLIDEAGVLYFAINDLDFNLKCLKYASNKGKIIVHNLSSEIISNPEYLSHAMESSDIQILNEVEYQKLGSVKGNIEDICKKHSRLNTIIVTRGKKGSTVYTKEGNKIRETTIEPIFTEKGGVPLGLGDAYSAGIVYGIAQGWDLEKAAKFGSHLGAASFESEYSFISKDYLEKYKKKFERI